VLADKFRTSSLVFATSCGLFRVEKLVSDRIALSQHVVIVLAGSRQVHCVFDVIARWTLENDQTYEPVRHFFDTVIYLFCVMTLCHRRQLRHFLRAIIIINNESFSVSIGLLNVEQHSIDTIVATETLINAVQNEEPSIWNTKVNSSEEDKSWHGPELPAYFSIQKGSLFTVT